MRFTIRDMVWLTVVVAVLCGWGIDQKRLRNEIDRKATMEVNLDDVKRHLRPGYVLRVNYLSDGQYSVDIVPIGTPSPAPKSN
jgi:hypothetical protein